MELKYAVVILKTIDDLDYTRDSLEHRIDSLREANKEEEVRLLYIAHGSERIFIENEDAIPRHLLTCELFPSGPVYMVYDQVTDLEDISYVCRHPEWSELFGELRFLDVRFPYIKLLPSCGETHGMVEITLEDN